MALNAANFIVKGPIRSADMKQFVDLFTGVMTDQPVTFKNALSLGGNQGNTTAPLSLYGAVGQTSNLLNLYPDPSSLQPTFGFAAYGRFSWGPGGAGVQDTFLSRIALQNGHATDTAGLFIDPHLEVTGAVQASAYNFNNGTTIDTDGALSVRINQDLTVNRRINLPYSGGSGTQPSIQMANNAFISARDSANSIIPVFSATTDNWNSFHLGTNGLAFTNTANTTRVATISPNGTGNFFYLTVSDGSNGVLQARNGNLYLRPAASNTWCIMDTGQGLLMPGGSIQVQNGYVSAGAPISGAVGDLTANRGNNTGYLYIGNATHYLGFDGSVYQMPTSGLNVGGTVNASNAFTVASAANSMGAPIALPQTLGPKLNLYDAGGSYYGIGVSSGEMYFSVPSTATFAFRQNNGAGTAFVQILTSGVLQANNEIHITNPYQLVFTPANEFIGPGESVGHPSTVVMGTHAYVNFDLGVGHTVTCQNVVQTSDPGAKANMTVMADGDCMLRIREPGVQVYSYQLAPPTPAPDPPPPITPTPTDIGFDATQVYAHSPEFAAINDQGAAVGVNYANMAALLWGALRDLDKRCVAYGI